MGRTQGPGTGTGAGRARHGNGAMRAGPSWAVLYRAVPVSAQRAWPIWKTLSVIANHLPALFHWRSTFPASAQLWQWPGGHGSPRTRLRRSVGGPWTWRKGSPADCGVPSPIPRANTGEEQRYEALAVAPAGAMRPCLVRALLEHGGRGGACLPWSYTSPQSNTRTHTFASTTGDGRFSDLTLRTPPPPPSVIGSSSSTDCTSPPPRPSNFSPHPFRSPTSIDRSRKHGYGHDVHRLPVPSCSCFLRGRGARRRVLIGRPGRREPRPRPRHLRLRDRSASRLAKLRSTSEL